MANSSQGGSDSRVVLVTGVSRDLGRRSARALAADPTVDRVIGVDVVVTDKKGNAVTGLTKDDFQIFENGIEKPISNFSEIEGKAVAQSVVVPLPGAPPPPPALAAAASAP